MKRVAVMIARGIIWWSLLLSLFPVLLLVFAAGALSLTRRGYSAERRKRAVRYLLKSIKAHLWRLLQALLPEIFPCDCAACRRLHEFGGTPIQPLHILH